MTRVRCITEMGMGVDVHGKDAPRRRSARLSDAIRHSSLGFFRMLGKTANDMFVDVTIGGAGSRRGRHLGGRQGTALRNGDGHCGQGRAGNSGRAGW